MARLRAAGCVFAEDEAELLLAAASSPEALESMVRQRAAGIPLEYVVGWADFCGLRVAVSAPVFVPRRRTRFLVREAVARTRPGAVVLDLCCGSGALGLALASSVQDIELHAADIDPAAVDCARTNLRPVGAHVYAGDLFEPLPRALRGRFATILANVPYVPSAAIALLPPEARDHEPLRALDGGADGLDLIRRVATEAVQWLAPGGAVLVETSAAQAAAAEEAFGRGGLEGRTTASARFGATVVVGTAPGSEG